MRNSRHILDEPQHGNRHENELVGRNCPAARAITLVHRADRVVDSSARSLLGSTAGFQPTPSIFRGPDEQAALNSSPSVIANALVLLPTIPVGAAGFVLPPAARWSPPKTGPSRSRYTPWTRPSRCPRPDRPDGTMPTPRVHQVRVSELGHPGNVRDEVHLPILAERKPCASLRFRNATRRQHQSCCHQNPETTFATRLPQMISYPDSFPVLLAS